MKTLDGRCGPSVGVLAKLVAMLTILCMSLVAWAQPAGTVRGTVFTDLNYNGIKDSGEGGFAGVTVTLVGRNGTKMAVSDDAGQYSFQDNEPGRYIVSAVPTKTSGPSVGGSGGVQVDVPGPGEPPGDPVDFPWLEKCVEIKLDKILCNVDPTLPGGYTLTFSVTNNSPFPISHIYFLQGPPVVFQSNLTGSPNYIPVNPAIPVGGTQQFQVTVTGLQPGQYCWEMAFHNQNLSKCCLTRVCVDFPKCDCLQFLEETVECNPDGSNSYLWCFTVQNLTQQTVHYITIAPPAGVTMNPVVIPVNAPNGIPPGGTWQACVTISGQIPGGQLCFEFGLHDRQFKACCAITKCIEIPQCGCTIVPGVCCAKKMDYSDQKFGPFTGSTLAAVTCAGFFPTDPVLALQNLVNYQCVPPTLGVNWNPVPLGYHGPNDSWNVAAMGTIFGVTIDDRGHIYVTASSCYGNNAYPNGSGTIYVIENGTANVLQFVNNLPQSTTQPALGNITFDCDHDQFFVTNLEDGKIYRIKRTIGNPLVGTWGAGDVYDPFTPDDGSGGFAPLGERVWGIQWHNNRIYFGRYVEDQGRPSAQNNEIWSVALNGLGDIVPGSLTLEVTLPNMTGDQYGSPPSDISFSPEGKMLVGERTMYNDESPSAHKSRVLEFDCGPAGTWVLVNNDPDLFFAGSLGPNSPSCAGGVDYDYSNVNCGPGTGRRVWCTADYVGPFPGNNGVVYGIQGFPITGGTPANSILQDVTGVADGGKTQIGDIEIHCPSAIGLVGTVNLGDYVGTPQGKQMELQVRLTSSSNPVFSTVVTLDANGKFTVPLDGLSPGIYDVAIKGKCWLRQKLTRNLDSTTSAVTWSLKNGDVNGDNAVTTDDYIILSDAFDTNVGDPGYVMTADLNGDGSITTDDYIILSQNFDCVGDQ